MALEEGAVRGELAPVADAARILVDLGIGAVMVTLGPARRRAASTTGS